MQLIVTFFPIIIIIVIDQNGIKYIQYYISIGQGSDLQSRCGGQKMLAINRRENIVK
jgi:hypothetical protein